MEFKIKFRAFKIGDEVLINKMRDDEEREGKVGGMRRYVSLDREAKWVYDIIMGDNQSVIYLAITEVDSEDIIGYVSLHDIDYREGTCFWSGIKLSKDCAGKGYGFQAGLLITKYVFEELRMVRCIGKCQEFHEPMIKVMEKIGYRKEGLMRKALYKHGVHINQWLFSITDDDYKEVKKKYDL